jgi:RNA polymerase sigma-70 factor, ECF subfamily
MSARGERSINFFARGVYVSQDAEDVALVRRCMDGDASAFAGIVERYQRVLFTVALRMLGDREEAADAAQTAFVRAYGKLASFDPAQRFFSWIYRILLNECLNVQRSRRAREPIRPDVLVGDSPADLLETKERRQRVQAAILALPHDYREVIVLRHFADLSYDEIADALQLSPGLVKSRLHSARQRLGQMLLDYRIHV